MVGGGAAVTLLARIAPAAEALALACLGAVLAWLSLSGRYAFFVPPSARLGILASGAGLLACALALSSRVGSGGEPSGTSSRRALTRALVTLLASALLVLPFRVSPSELASSALTSRGASEEQGAGDGEDLAGGLPSPSDDTPASGADQSAGADASSDETLTLTTENFSAQVEELSSRGRAHDGQRIDLVGFVMSEESARGQASIPRITAQESFAVARMAIWCCAADAYAVGFAVRWEGATPAADSWVHVRGTLRLRGSKALVIEADSVEETNAPNPEFVVQAR